MGKLTLVLSLFFQICMGSISDEALGENDQGTYYGPDSPLVFYDQYKYQRDFYDAYNEKWYFQSRIGNEIFYLDNFLQGEFLVGNYCPDEVFYKNKDYFRFLFRILSLSYIHDANKLYLHAEKRIGGKLSCNIDWGEFYKSCQPNSSDMKLFLKNTKYVLGNIPEINVPFSESKKDFVNSWILNIEKKNIKDLPQQRISNICNGKKCKFNKKQIKKSLKNICNSEKEMAFNICNEKDRGHGLSFAPEAYLLLLKSNALRNISPYEYQMGCLRRYVRAYKHKEDRKQELEDIFTYVYSDKKSKNSSYEQGRLFIVGALKEFQEKGLTNIFSDIDLAEKAKIKKVENKIIEKPKIEVIKLPKYNKPKEKKKKIVKKVVKEQITAFRQASLFRENNGLESIQLDMEQFKFDFIFTLELKKKYEPVIKRFSSIKSLQSMKDLDRLGSERAPVPLKFLKYLIDNEIHQGIFNLVQVLGDKFYVINDIDKKTHKDIILIQNSKATGHQWQISILQELN